MTLLLGWKLLILAIFGLSIKCHGYTYCDTFNQTRILGCVCSFLDYTDVHSTTEVTGREPLICLRYKTYKACSRDITPTCKTAVVGQLETIYGLFCESNFKESCKFDLSVDLTHCPLKPLCDGLPCYIHHGGKSTLLPSACPRSMLIIRTTKMPHGQLVHMKKMVTFRCNDGVISGSNLGAVITDIISVDCLYREVLIHHKSKKIRTTQSQFTTKTSSTTVQPMAVVHSVSNGTSSMETAANVTAVPSNTTTTAATGSSQHTTTDSVVNGLTTLDEVVPISSLTTTKQSISTSKTKSVRTSTSHVPKTAGIFTAVVPRTTTTTTYKAVTNLTTAEAAVTTNDGLTMTTASKGTTKEAGNGTFTAMFGTSELVVMTGTTESAINKTVPSTEDVIPITTAAVDGRAMANNTKGVDVSPIPITTSAIVNVTSVVSTSSNGTSGLENKLSTTKLSSAATSSAVTIGFVEVTTTPLSSSTIMTTSVSNKSTKLAESTYSEETNLTHGPATIDVTTSKTTGTTAPTTTRIPRTVSIAAASTSTTGPTTSIWTAVPVAGTTKMLTKTSVTTSTTVPLTTTAAAADYTSAITIDDDVSTTTTDDDVSTTTTDDDVSTTTTDDDTPITTTADNRDDTVVTTAATDVPATLDPNLLTEPYTAKGTKTASPGTTDYATPRPEINNSSFTTDAASLEVTTAKPSNPAVIDKGFFEYKFIIATTTTKPYKAMCTLSVDPSDVEAMNFRGPVNCSDLGLCNVLDGEAITFDATSCRNAFSPFTDMYFSIFSPNIPTAALNGMDTGCTDAIVTRQHPRVALYCREGKLNTPAVNAEIFNPDFNVFGTGPVKDVTRIECLRESDNCVPDF